jgi:hypothetical protein
MVYDVSPYIEACHRERIRLYCARKPVDLNRMEGWLEFRGQGPASLSVLKLEVGDDGSIDYSSEEMYSPVCISQGKGNPTLKIDGDVKFKDGTTFNEPHGGWKLSNFLDMIEGYETKRRLKPENYFLGTIDRQHVLWAGMDKVNGVYVIHWD